MLKNKNITLRYIRESDIADYIRWTTTETEWYNWDAPWEWEGDDGSEFVERQKNNLDKTPERYTKLEIDTAEGKHIGWVSCYKTDEEKLAVGIDIPAVGNRGHGYGYNALAMFMAYLFEHEDVLYTQTWSGNTPMLRLAEKLGFTECGRIPGIREVRGGKYDALTFLVTKAEFFEKVKFNW